MKKQLYIFLPAMLLAVTLLTAFGGDDSNTDYPGGAPAGYTGSPGDGQHCVACHNGSASNQSGIITSDVPAQGYTPGSNYTITVTLSGSGKKGFEVSPQTAAGDLVGTLTAGSGNKLVGSGKYCTQSSAVQGSSATWNFTWTAPAAGTGSVTFYGAFTITKSVTKLSTLVVNENTAVPLSATATATPGTVCSGQSSQLNVTASGGSGTYTYSWTSNPAGFTSTLQNPVVAPTQNTQYFAEVNDGTSTATGTTQVNVTATPTANAGTDTTYCVSVPEILLHGTATGYTSATWTTSGDGTFANAGNLNTSYFPGAGDKSTLSVNLTLTATPQAPCTAPVSDARSILFDPCGVGVPVLTGNAYSFSMFPNPSGGIFNLSSSSAKDEAVTITVIDLNGKTILTENLRTASENLDHRMDLSFLKKGVYFIRMESKSGVKTRKMIID